MKVIAKSNNIRHSARKLRLVADLIRGMSLVNAQDVLKNLRQRSALPILLTLKQARSNALNNFHLAESSLKFEEIQINEGPTYKRWRAVSRGRGNAIMKRTAHIQIVVSGEKPIPVAKNSFPVRKAAKPGRKNLTEKKEEVKSVKEKKRGTEN